MKKILILLLFVSVKSSAQYPRLEFGGLASTHLQWGAFAGVGYEKKSFDQSTNWLIMADCSYEHNFYVIGGLKWHKKLYTTKTDVNGSLIFGANYTYLLRAEEKALDPPLTSPDTPPVIYPENTDYPKIWTPFVGFRCTDDRWFWELNYNINTIQFKIGFGL